MVSHLSQNLPSTETFITLICVVLLFKAPSCLVYRLYFLHAHTNTHRRNQQLLSLGSLSRRDPSSCLCASVCLSRQLLHSSNLSSSNGSTEDLFRDSIDSCDIDINEKVRVCCWASLPFSKRFWSPRSVVSKSLGLVTWFYQVSSLEKKVAELENEILQNGDLKSKLKQENTQLVHRYRASAAAAPPATNTPIWLATFARLSCDLRVHELEEQLKDQETRGEQNLLEELRRHREAFSKMERDKNTQIDLLTNRWDTDRSTPDSLVVAEANGPLTMPGGVTNICVLRLHTLKEPQLVSLGWNSWRRRTATLPTTCAGSNLRQRNWTRYKLG